MRLLKPQNENPCFVIFLFSSYNLEIWWHYETFKGAAIRGMVTSHVIIIKCLSLATGTFAKTWRAGVNT
jgi:hypothetical protein